jgi:hypothetical protein
MSQRETEMTRWYWKKKVGGVLVEEFMVVPGSPTQGRRLVDGIIVMGEKKKLMKSGSRIDITGKDVVVIQTKNRRLGMGLMGQTLFSAQLIRRLKPRSLKSVALCAADDGILRPMLEAYEGCEVFVCPPEVCKKPTTKNARPA